ncbi:hypothetical protein Tco_1518615 [Tanacetum coccineum]
MGTPTQVCVWSCPNFCAPAGRPFSFCHCRGVIETQLYRLEWQLQDVDDHATRSMMRIYVLEHRAHIDTLEDTGSSA